MKISTDPGNPSVGLIRIKTDKYMEPLELENMGVSDSGLFVSLGFADEFQFLGVGEAKEIRDFIDGWLNNKMPQEHIEWSRAEGGMLVGGREDASKFRDWLSRWLEKVDG